MNVFRRTLNSMQLTLYMFPCIHFNISIRISENCSAYQCLFLCVWWWWCRACNCSSVGSVNTSCDVITGQCPCKLNVVGLKCDTCLDGTFNLAPNNVDGCQNCFCYGRAETCTSAAGFTLSLIHSSRSTVCSSVLLFTTFTVCVRSRAYLCWVLRVYQTYTTRSCRPIGN